jgi:hypothetical protein
MQNAETVLGVILVTGEPRCGESSHARFGGGLLEKGPFDRTDTSPCSLPCGRLSRARTYDTDKRGIT